MAVINLAPKPYIIESIIHSDHMDWITALAELVDNAFGEAAGNASTVTISVWRNKIMVEDDGGGIESLEPMFSLGDSKSRFSPIDIGRYGCGAKHAAIWIGKHYCVETAKAGRLRIARVNWDAVRNQHEFGKFEDHQVECDPTRHGTKITINYMWPTRKRLHVGSICRQLSETFAPALVHDRAIRVIDYRKDESGIVYTLKPWRPEGLSDVVQFDDALDGRDFHAEVGILTNAYSSDTGLRICYGHRVVCRLTQLAGKTIPARVFGYIELGPQWKDRLSTNKTKIVDSDDLEEYLLNHPQISQIMSNAEEYHFEMLIEKIMPRLQLNISKALRRASEGDQFAKRKQPENEGKRQRKHPAPPADRADDGDPATEEDSSSTGLMVKVVREGNHIVGRVEEDNDNFAVLINLDCPACRDAFDEAQKHQRGYYPALFSIIANVFSIEIAKHRSDADTWLKRRFNLTREQPGMTMVETFMNWWMFAVTSSLKQEDAGDEPSN